MDTSLSPELSAQRSHARINKEVIEKKEKFFPSGAIAFFFALVALCLVIWFGIYFLMLERA